MNTEGKVYSILFTFILSFVFVAALAIVYFTLKPKIEVNNEFQLDRAILNAMGIPYESNEQAVTMFHEQIKKKEFDGSEYYLYTPGSGETIIAVIQAGQGLWGEIDIAVAIDPGKQIITGFDIVKQNETPGLGGRIDEPWFKNQFRNETYNPASGITMGEPGSGDTNHTNATVDAITGASQTSHLLSIIINNAVKRLVHIAGGIS